MEIFGLKMTQEGVKPAAPRSLRDMRGFMGLLNQSTFCLSGKSRKLMEKLKDRLKSIETWKWKSGT